VPLCVLSAFVVELAFLALPATRPAIPAASLSPYRSSYFFSQTRTSLLPALPYAPALV
jgi:hypothetical protein